MVSVNESDWSNVIPGIVEEKDKFPIVGDGYALRPSFDLPWHQSRSGVPIGRGPASRPPLSPVVEDFEHFVLGEGHFLGVVGVCVVCGGTEIHQLSIFNILNQQ